MTSRLMMLTALAMVVTLLAARLATAQSATITDTFADAAQEFNIPVDVLLALGWTRSHLRPQTSELGEYGIMQLPAAQIAEAAAALNRTEAAIQTDMAANVRAAAFLLRDRAIDLFPQQDTLAAAQWFEVVAAVSFRDHPTVGREHARQVFAVLSQGLTASVDGETVVIAPWAEAAPLSQSADVRLASEDYAPAWWAPAHPANYTDSDRQAEHIDMLVIHTMQGYYAAAVPWFSAPRASSAHYFVRSSDGDITQMVREADIAWHAGDWSTNVRSIGIEHEGFVDDPTWYTDVSYRATAQLVRHLVDRYNIPVDRQHIIGHNEVPGCPNPLGGGANCHTDPGPYWDWAYFMALVADDSYVIEPTPITGTIQLQGRSNHSGTQIFLTSQGCDATPITARTPYTTTSASGTFVVNSRAAGCLHAQQPGYLNAQRPWPPGSLAPLTLPGGDITGDGTVNVFDLAFVSRFYNAADPAADLNADGVVNVLDLILVAGNFGASGPVVWE